jgi:hypothetical protein
MKYTHARTHLEVIEVTAPNARPLHGTDRDIMSIAEKAWPEFLQEVKAKKEGK